MAVDIAPRLDRATLQREIARTLELLHPASGDVWEIRALEVPSQGTVSGYYNDAAKCARDVLAQLDGKASGVYVTINPVLSDLLARADNRLQARAKSTTSDAEIVRRRWLPLDFDPQRPTGISSTDAQHAAALERAEGIATYLTGMGWPAPIVADSGNGAHLLYALDLPSDKEDATVRPLLERVLKGLAAWCDDADGANPCIRLDTGNFNAARILKLWGTMVRKGDALPDRPHRRSQLLSAPDGIEPVSRAQLEELANELYPASASASKTALGKTTSTSTPGRDWIDDGGQYLRDHQITVRSERDNPSAHVYVLEACVWNPAHTDHSAWVMQRHADGTIAAGCSHNSCRGKKLVDFRDAVEPRWRERASASKSALDTFTSTSTRESHVQDVRDREFPLMGANGRNRAHEDAGASATSTPSGSLTGRGPNGEFPLLNLALLKQVGAIKPEELVPGKIMKRSSVISYGDADTGKSYYAQHTCFELAAAGVPVWYVAAEGFDGIYMRILAWLAKHPGQNLDALRVIPIPVNIFKGGDRHILSAQARDQPDPSQPQLIVLDTLHRCTAGARESDNSDMVCVADTAALWRGDFGATMWSIHHEGKGASQGMRGASCLRDDADSVQYIFRGGDYSVIECEKQKDGIPRFEPEAFTLESCSLDHWGYDGLHANVLTPLTSDHIIEARRLWAADQRRQQTGKNAPGNEDDAKALTGELEKAFTVFTKAYEEHPDGVFKSTWRDAWKAAAGKPGSFDWLTKELEKRGKVVMPDTTGRYLPGDR